MLLRVPKTRWSQVEECVDGGSLKNWVAKSMRGKRLYKLRDGVRWLMQMAQALQYLHECLPMVIHRDLKLDNILLQGGWSYSNESLLLAPRYSNRQHTAGSCLLPCWQPEALLGLTLRMLCLDHLPAQARTPALPTSSLPTLD